MRSQPTLSTARRTTLLALLLTCALALPLGARALSPPNGAAASLVLGQRDFGVLEYGPSQKLTASPRSVAVDPTSGKVFVSDSWRILRFASLSQLHSGAAAEIVLGQTSFFSSTAGLAADRFDLPADITIDSAGRLWLADMNNNRVLRFDRAAQLATGARASAVLGQPNFTSNTTATTQNGLSGPEAVVVDSAGTLWVSDTGNSRVLRFDKAASKPNGANADGVLGQNDFTSRIYGRAQNTISTPGALAVDGAGRLWVADWNSARVLRFDSAANKPNGANADGLLGQLSFTTSNFYGPQVISPTGLAAELGTERLWVSDYEKHRVLRFDKAASKPNGADADGVLGQTDISSTSVCAWPPSMAECLSPIALHSPKHLWHDPNTDVLWVADVMNNRVVAFDPSAQAPTGTPTLTATRTVAATPTRTPAATPTAAPPVLSRRAYLPFALKSP